MVKPLGCVISVPCNVVARLCSKVVLLFITVIILTISWRLVSIRRCPTDVDVKSGGGLLWRLSDTLDR